MLKPIRNEESLRRQRFNCAANLFLGAMPVRMDSGEAHVHKHPSGWIRGDEVQEFEGVANCSTSLEDEKQTGTCPANNHMSNGPRHIPNGVKIGGYSVPLDSFRYLGRDYGFPG
jgi:hypothetical protein